MKLTFLVVGVPLFVSGCTSTLPEVVASTGHPDTVIDVHDPTRLVQHRGDAAIAIAAILEGERGDVGSQCRFVIRALCDLALCGTMLAENPACPSFGHTKFCSDMVHTGAAAGGA